ncbi:MAG: indole-3-glycerol-phosphate synthase [Thermodesulfobacteriota bacterium]
MLEKFRQAKAAEIERLIALEDQGLMPAPFEGERPDFIRALWENEPLAVIAEYKRASPSRGEINMGLSPEDVARAYARAGAAAISVLTEETYFKGSLEYLSRMAGAGLPLLRKDFILHPVQVIETASTPASAFLLIARMSEKEELREMLGLAMAFDLAAVVEVFDEADLEKAQDLDPEIIQVNSRDLDKLTTDLAVAERLARHKPEGQIWIAASGISKPGDVERMAAAGYDAVLVGTSLMQGGDPGAALKALTRR